MEKRKWREGETHPSFRDLLDAPSESKVCDHEDALVVDEEVRGFHVAMKDAVLKVAKSKLAEPPKPGERRTDLVQVRSSLEQLLRVLLDVVRLELDRRVLEQAGEIVVHVGKDHVRLAELERVALS